MLNYEIINVCCSIEKRLLLNFNSKPVYIISEITCISKSTISDSSNHYSCSKLDSHMFYTYD